MEREDFIGWIDAYERAWRTPGTTALEELFGSDATYVAAPFDPPLQGRAAIKTFWEAERESAEEVFTFTREMIAVEGDVCVARVEVGYGAPPTRVYRDLWIVKLDFEGHCVAFEEWPFFPGQPRSAINSQGDSAASRYVPAADPQSVTSAPVRGGLSAPAGASP